MFRVREGNPFISKCSFRREFVLEIIPSSKDSKNPASTWLPFLRTKSVFNQFLPDIGPCTVFDFLRLKMQEVEALLQPGFEHWKLYEGVPLLAIFPSFTTLHS
jgi:hypothetical protein